MKPVTCLIGLAVGCLLLWGGQLPAWLLKGEVLIVAAFSLVYGFSAFCPRLPAWVRQREVLGVVLVALGCVALFVPAQFIVSALLVGSGARLVMASGDDAQAGGSKDLIVKQGGGIGR